MWIGEFEGFPCSWRGCDGIDPASADWVQSLQSPDLVIGSPLIVDHTKTRTLTTSTSQMLLDQALQLLDLFLASRLVADGLAISSTKQRERNGVQRKNQEATQTTATARQAQLSQWRARFLLPPTWLWKTQVFHPGG